MENYLKNCHVVIFYCFYLPSYRVIWFIIQVFTAPLDDKSTLFDGIASLMHFSHKNKFAKMWSIDIKRIEIKSLTILIKQTI
jgi:hypothetical protein